MYLRSNPCTWLLWGRLRSSRGIWSVSQLKGVGADAGRFDKETRCIWQGFLPCFLNFIAEGKEALQLLHMNIILRRCLKNSREQQL